MLIREKEHGVLSAPDTGLTALQQTFSIAHIHTHTLTHSGIQGNKDGKTN